MYRRIVSGGIGNGERGHASEENTTDGERRETEGKTGSKEGEIE
jgi:hypothetical protein